MLLFIPHAHSAPPRCDPARKIVHIAQPAYPPVEYRVGFDASVTLEFTILKDGEVTDAVVLARDPPDVHDFDVPSIQAVHGSRLASSARECRQQMKIKFVIKQ